MNIERFKPNRDRVLGFIAGAIIATIACALTEKAHANENGEACHAVVTAGKFVRDDVPGRVEGASEQSPVQRYRRDGQRPDRHQ